MSATTHMGAFGRAWRAESDRRRSARKPWVETEFLPAALEVTETPPSPAGRAMLWVIVMAAAFALAWSFLSRVDVVATAEGRLVPAGRLQSVEAAESGVVRAIHVREGQRVRAGQLLLELDPTYADADAGTARSEFSTATLTQARAAALLSYVGGGSPAVTAPAGAEPAAIEAERQLVDARIREYEAKRASLQERRIGAEAALRMSREQVGKASEILPIAEKQLSAYRELESRGYAARLRTSELEERVVGLRRDVGVERARMAETAAQITMLDRELAQAAQAFRGEAAREGAEAEGILATRREAVRKADQRQSLQQMRAPVTGVVHEIALTTEGEVAEAGQPLITIVPEGEDLVVEALLLNRDAGAVKRGDLVIVKLEAYPFTRYGALEGRLEHVSPDAVADERRGLVFPARVVLTRRTLDVDGRAAALSPGMSATAEVVTGRRRVIDYLLSPVVRATREAGRER
jgi:hemolysin D